MGSNPTGGTLLKGENMERWIQQASRAYAKKHDMKYTTALRHIECLIGEGVIRFDNWRRFLEEK